jgi:hypothetical protein
MSSGTPTVGELLPRAAEAFGVRDKLAGYSLDMTHEEGRSKAHGFARILGITIEDIGYLEGALHTGVLLAPVGSMRDKPPWGVECVVVVPVRGLGEKSGRVVNVRTAWLLTGTDDPPRMTTAFPRP